MLFIQRWRLRSVFDIELIDQRPGFIRFKATGKNVERYFKNESGGHRWQRVPPTEKKGRYQTSTITVVVLESVSPKEIKIDPRDLDWKFTRGTGPGGQHKNKTDSCVNLTHIPTGIKVKVDGRSQWSNKEVALTVLRNRIKAKNKSAYISKMSAIRKQQAGSGMRGDKVRTIRIRDDIVVDHELNRRISYKKYRRGDLSGLR